MFVLALMGWGCKQKPAETAGKEDLSKDTISFFQVDEYIKSQIREVNKTPYFIYRIQVINGTKDSLAINTNDFNRLAIPFLQTAINEPGVKKNYTENVFHDQTTQSYTLSYTTSNKALPVQSVDVLLNEDAQTVKRIFIRKFFSYDDSSAIEQLSWKPGIQFQVNRLVQTNDNKEISRELTVVWNGKE